MLSLAMDVIRKMADAIYAKLVCGWTSIRETVDENHSRIAPRPDCRQRQLLNPSQGRSERRRLSGAVIPSRCELCGEKRFGGTIAGSLWRIKNFAPNQSRPAPFGEESVGTGPLLTAKKAGLDLNQLQLSLTAR